jgi:hypothetical protein
MVTRLKMKDSMMTILPGEFWILERSLLLGRVGQIGSSDAALVKAVWDSRVKPQF